MGVIVGPFKEPPIRAGLTERKLDIIHTLQSQLHIKKKSWQPEKGNVYPYCVQMDGMTLKSHTQKVFPFPPHDIPPFRHYSGGEK